MMAPPMPSKRKPGAAASGKDVTDLKRQNRPSNGLNPKIAFCFFLAASLCAALFSPIQDCDEVFNYWEPSHYLNHGYGLQTWEYSPVYAIRSWTYAGIHSTLLWIGSLLPFVSTKSLEFYFLRIVLATVCAACETRLFTVISRTLNPKIGYIFLIVTATSAGMFHASAAYLPSSFAMYTTMLGTAAFMDWKGGLRTAQGIMWFGIGATLGWPFAAALVFPFLFEEVFVASVTGDGFGTAQRFLDGTVRSFLVLAVQAAIDVFFYRKLLCVPWNIVAYNIFGGAGKGPDIYGTEPWHFYIRNLALNFNIWFFLALASVPLLFVQNFVRRIPATRQSFLRNLTFLSPFYLWLAIFTLQPHKEERFMYPAYPLLALNTAMSVHILLNFLGGANSHHWIRNIPAWIRLVAVSVLFIGAVALGLLRTAGMTTAYSAPLQIYTRLNGLGVAHPGDTVCLAKEWYRFPSSYFLPNGMKAKFVKSAFSGLLPGEFSEAKVGFGFFPGAWLEPPGMNNENIEDPGKYTNIEHCSFLVDSQLPSTTPSTLEPSYILDTKTWEPLLCKPFLDHSQTHLLGRLLWIPDHPLDIWKSSSFKRPSAPPYPNWSLQNTKPLPYRPFRPKYFVTLGLRNMVWDEWIELDSHYPKYHDLKAKRIAERGEKCCRTAPEAFDGAVELLEELCDYLPQRYPSLYVKTDVGMDNIITNESFNITERPLKEDPMQMAARFTQDDLAIMFEKEDGQYYLLAGAILLAGFWRLEDKFGMPLSEIHTSGDVPHYKEKMEKGMMNFFRRLKPEAPMCRNNYFLQVDEDLAWSTSIGSEDSDVFNWGTAEKNKMISHHHFRSERQSLRRLPRSGGVVFTIRTYFHPITEICEEPYVPGRLAQAVRSWDGDVSRYRGRERFGDVLLEYLDGKHEEQIKNGLDMTKEEETYNYPY
ncbi:hypothetical protein EJ08DRAFT_689215 [Tothia fuscella]|uniref:Mannosyltransferase n=1 Tax=Tothia fuscella TaxID=1048955 RepID=A0A9P4NL48_9PEZI|nr:hypothetical protein EJ08DRAFT_689215 [Tothia fuscella]